MVYQCVLSATIGNLLVKLFRNEYYAGLLLCSLEELVRDGENGRIFHSADMLADQLLDWFCDFPNNESARNEYKKKLSSFQNQRWHSAWMATAWPHLSSINL